jgi:diguanylate cyclase (GGDEF)-like protein/PAS domain S-box-containing protein
MSTIPTSGQNRFAQAGIAFVTVLGTVVASLMLARITGHVTAVWPANGLVLAFLLAPARPDVILTLAATMAANLLASIGMGESPLLAFGTSIADVVEIMLALSFVRNRTPGMGTDLSQPATLIRFMVFSVMLGPTVAAMLAASLSPGDAPDGFMEAFFGWTVSHGLGIAIFTPFALTWLTGAVGPLFRQGRALQTVTAWILLVAVTSVILVQDRYPLLICWIFPPLILAAFLMGFAGSSIGLFLVFSTAAAFTVAGYGPFADKGSESVARHIVDLQLFIVAALIVTLPVSAVLAQRNRLARRVRESEDRYRTLAEHLTDIVVRATLEGRCMYVSSAAKEMLGWHAPELVDGHLIDLAHPDDRDAVRRAITKLQEGETKTSLVYRARHRQGHHVWVELKARVLAPSERGEQEMLLSIRDVMDRKQAEAKLELANRRLTQLANRDGLTELFNRRFFDETLRAEWQRALCGPGNSVGLLLIDVDHFKSYNDTYGHQAGDDCLRTVARTINGVIKRSGDCAARYGGEEFAVILAATDLAGAIHIGEQICASIGALDIVHAGAGQGSVTVSVGVSSMTPDAATSPEMLLRSADQALYRAKHDGRNRVCTPRAAVRDFH